MWVFFVSLLLVVNCTDPGIPANSIRESKIEHGNFTFGSVVFYDCNPGYYLFGSPVLTCLPLGHWDKPLPECIGTVLASFLQDVIIVQNCFLQASTFSYHVCTFMRRLIKTPGKEVCK